MKALSDMPFRTERCAIYLLNVTIHTDFRRVLEAVPQDVLICVNEMVQARYREFLRNRGTVLIHAAEPRSFAPLIRNLKDGKPVFVALDTDQATFQAVASYAFRRQVPLIPVYGHTRLPSMGEALPLTDARKTLDELQEFLLMSYLGRRDDTEVNLFDELVRSARYYGEERVICKDISGKATYREILLNSYVLGTTFRRMFARTERVGVLLPNSIGQVVVLFALFYAGITPVMLNYSSGIQTILDACETADLRTVLTSREFIQKGQLQDVEAALSVRLSVHEMEDVRNRISVFEKVQGLLAWKRGARASKGLRELVLFTSGSEYKPRGVVLSHENIYANVQQTRSVIDFGTQDRMLNAMPMFHSFGLTAGALLPLLAGIQTYLYPSPLHYKRIPELAGEERSTILFGTSSFLEKYGQNATPEQFSSLRYAVVGAERLKPEVERAWLQKFQLQIMQGYGATETSPILCLDTPINHRQGTVGRLLPGISYRLLAVDGIPEGGVLHVQGPNVMKGYLLHGQGYVEQSGWYDTGDVVTVDDDGFVTIIGRLKRFAKIAGEMVSLNLVEQLAARAYDSPDFAAVTVPDEVRGERILLITTVAGLTLAPMRKIVEESGYSRMHVPSELRTINEFPLLGSGKTDYVSLRSLILADVR
ncbi:AMP-dependent synthetase and ligase [Alicyclobacillus hesperidum URH17-3-68]|uniref:AMP-binding protein n=1 Tax=Alicyclobacillus hesperidum TaxID=89784 RepID=UPI000281C188|nr:AMP-binding protein [Alicyclobacillus hesperidum]EJY55413.1 AMP-dependent synthetase and ligase [Alicyclobacillus hesperidum URH17-3-68]